MSNLYNQPPVRKPDLPPGVFLGPRLEVALSRTINLRPPGRERAGKASQPVKRPPAPVRARHRIPRRRVAAPPAARSSRRPSCHGRTGPPGEGDPDRPSLADLPLRSGGAQ
jgi:hypothetical protein